MDKTYQDPSHAGSFGGVDALFRAAKGTVSKKEIGKWLEGIDAYTLHKPARRSFLRNRVIVSGINDQFQADLVDMQKWSGYNKGFRYLLTCIDVFSKYAWTVPLKNKTGKAIIDAFTLIFRERKPKNLQTDKGTEFTNAKFQRFLKSHEVRFFTTHNETKASIVERFNRTLKTKMWKYFTAKNTYRYIDVLSELLKSYNASFHRSIQMPPIEVTLENESDVHFALYGDMKKPKKKCAFSIGDTVRVSKHKLTFEKGYETNWSEELFTVIECVKRDPPVYRIQDLLSEPIQGTFYAQELQKVQTKENYSIEKILRKRIKDGHLQYLVKFVGYPSKFNQWIMSSDITKI